MKPDAPSPAPSGTPRRRPRHAGLHLAPLVSLFRQSMTRSWGMRLARGAGIVLFAGAALMIWLLSSGEGVDTANLSIAARSAAAAVWLCGGTAALAMARSPKDATNAAALSALATAHGYSDE